MTPSEFEFELFRAEQDTERKFRILLNMITTFASTVSCKLMYWGNARPSLLHLPAEDVSNEMMWAKDGVGGTFLPSAEDAQRYLKANGLKHKDVDSYIQELIWGEARCS